MGGVRVSVVSWGNRVGTVVGVGGTGTRGVVGPESPGEVEGTPAENAGRRTTGHDRRHGECPESGWRGGRGTGWRNRSTGTRGCARGMSATQGVVNGAAPRLATGTGRVHGPDDSGSSPTGTPDLWGAKTEGPGEFRTSVVTSGDEELSGLWGNS